MDDTFSPVTVAQSITTGGSTSEPITGQVTDQHGDPVENATLVSHSITEPALDKSDAKSLKRQAEDLQSELTDPLPDEWQSFEDQFQTGNGLLDTEKFADGIDGTYAVAHTESDWSEGRTGYLKSEVDDPRITLPSNEQVIISLWDATEEPTGLVSSEGPVDSSIDPGQLTEGTVVIEQLSPTSEVVDKRTIETQVEFETNVAFNRGGEEYEAVRTSLPTGVYRIYPEDNPSAVTTVTVGSPSDISSAWEEDLRNEKDQLTQRAERIRNLLSQDHVARSTVRTNETGHFSVDVPSNAVKTDLRAMKGDGSLEDLSDPSIEDLREIQSGGYNGTFYLPDPSGTSVEPPAENVTVTTYRSPEVPFSNMESFADLQAFLEEQRLNETVDELRSEYDERFEEMERSSLERIYSDHKTLTETVPGAEDRYLERSDFEEVQAAEDLSSEELPRETSHMQVALAGIGEIEPPDLGGENPAEISDGLFNAEYPLPDGIDSDTIALEAHYPNGSSESIGEDYWSIGSSGVPGLGGQTLSVSDYPIPEDTPGVELRVRAASSDGGLIGGGTDGILDDRVSATNPTFGGSTPQINAVDFSTLAPGPSEQVSVGISPTDDTGYDSLVSAEAWNDDGEPITATVDSERDRASFETDGEGTHSVRLTYTNQQGDQFVVSERIDAKQQSRSDPATVRASGSPQSMTGVYAVTGEQLESARLESNGGTLSVDVIADDSDGPGELNIKPSNAMQGTTHTIDVEVVHGSSETAVQSNIPTNVHLTSPRSQALYWRSSPGFGGAPITHEGETRYGSVEKPSEGKHVIRTYTEPDGSVTISTVESAGYVDRASHQASQWVGNVPFVGSLVPFGSAIPSGEFVGVLGLAGIAVHRRRYAQ
ncbi:hypothetical protein [Natrinema versiforme]|uniref:Uncharacterized protein n=1 Tax=Natrinema versiforme JCM 10478 TaxID=1227496 RepID=L9Y543_9EURY|nr:hypothetical protein [Natrinema versiforme]ELY68842.1 hypothetical protein C489_05733 [Natrinema versiforme JCM 10478]